MAEVKITYRSNGKRHKEWFAKCEGYEGGISVVADYGYPTGDLLEGRWCFKAYTYNRVTNEKVCFSRIPVDGEALCDVRVDAPRGDRCLVPAMAKKIATAVFEHSVFLNVNRKTEGKMPAPKRHWVIENTIEVGKPKYFKCYDWDNKWIEDRGIMGKFSHPTVCWTYNVKEAKTFKTQTDASDFAFSASVKMSEEDNLHSSVARVTF